MLNKIVLLDTGGCDLDAYRDDCGQLALCLPDDMELSFNLKTEEVSDLEKIISEYTNSVELSINDIDIFKLGNVQYKKIDNVYSYRAFLALGGISMLSGFLYVNSTSESISTGFSKYSLQVIGTHQTWKEYLKENNLSVLDLGTFTWNKANLISLMSNDVYVDGGETIYPLLANFGRRFGEPNEVSIYDIRFLVYLLPLLNKMFCAAGYKLESKYLNSDSFRRKSAYALKPSFGIDPSIIKGFDTKVSTTAVEQVPVTGVSPSPLIIYDNSIIDKTSSYNNTTGIFTTTRDLTCLKIIWQGSGYESSGGGMTYPFTVQFLVIVFNTTTSMQHNFIVDEVEITSVGQTIDFYYEFDLTTAISEEIGLDPRGYFLPTYELVLGGSTSGGFFIDAGSQADFVPCNENHFLEDDIIDISGVLADSSTMYDLLVDIRKLFNLRIDTNEATRTVVIEPKPRSYETFGTLTTPSFSANGFDGKPSNPFDVVDITEYIDVCSNVEKKFTIEPSIKYYKFKFADSSDQYSRYLLYDNSTNPIYQNDTSNGRIGVEVNDVALSLFQPTLNDYDADISTLPTYGVYIPYMWEFEETEDGDLPEVGSNLGLRIFNVLGFDSQIYNNNVIGFVFEGTSIQAVPNVGQVFEANVTGYGSPSGVPMHDVVFKDNVRAVPNPKNLVNTYFPSEISSGFDAPIVTVKAKITNLLYKCINPRKVIRIFSEKNSLVRFNGNYSLISLTFNEKTKDATFELKPIIYCDNG